MEKRLFKNVINFLKSYKQEYIEITWNSYGGDLEWDWPWTSMSGRKIPNNVMNVIIQIVEEHLDSLFHNSYSENDAYRINAMIYPSKNKIVLSMDQEENVESHSGWEIELNEREELEEIVKEKNINVITAPYHGGGDSGYIENVFIKTKDGKKINDDNNKVENILYDELNNAFSGWEIDDGSYGEIVFENDLLSINHTWLAREFVDSGTHIELTENDFQD